MPTMTAQVRVSQEALKTFKGANISDTEIKVDGIRATLRPGEGSRTWDLLRIGEIEPFETHELRSFADVFELATKLDQHRKNAHVVDILRSVESHQVIEHNIVHE